MATLYREDLEGNRVVEKGPNFQGLEEMGSIPAQRPDGQVMLNKSFLSYGAWPAQLFGPASGAAGNKEMRSHALTCAVSTQNMLTCMTGACSYLSPSSAQEGAKRSPLLEGQMGQVSFQCENSAQKEGAGAYGQPRRGVFFKEDCIGSSGLAC